MSQLQRSGTWYIHSATKYHLLNPFTTTHALNHFHFGNTRVRVHFHTSEIKKNHAVVMTLEHNERQGFNVMADAVLAVGLHVHLLNNVIKMADYSPL